MYELHDGTIIQHGDIITNEEKGLVFRAGGRYTEQYFRLSNYKHYRAAEEHEVKFYKEFEAGYYYERYAILALPIPDPLERLFEVFIAHIVKRINPVCSNLSEEMLAAHISSDLRYIILQHLINNFGNMLIEAEAKVKATKLEEGNFELDIVCTYRFGQAKFTRECKAVTPTKEEAYKQIMDGLFQKAQQEAISHAKHGTASPTVDLLVNHFLGKDKIQE